MLGRELHLVFFYAYYLLSCAEWDGRCAAQDLVPFWRLGCVRRILPSAAGSQDDFLSDPGFGGGATHPGYNAVAVCEDRDLERGRGVEVLAEEEVTVVERCGLDFNYEVFWTWAWSWDVAN